MLEGTGGLERPVALALAEAGLPVVVVNPRQVRDFAKALGRRVKTDAVDARVLAHFAATMARPAGPAFPRDLHVAGPGDSAPPTHRPPGGRAQPPPPGRPVVHPSLERVIAV